jgi:tetratricopeptide (TPR) repeat protein
VLTHQIEDFAMQRLRLYQWIILLLLLATLIFVILDFLVIYIQSGQSDARQHALQAESTPPVVPVVVVPSSDDPVAMAAGYAQAAANSAANASLYAQDATSQVEQHMETANNLLGLFQNVTAIVGVLIPIIAIVGAYLGFNQINEAQKRLDEAQAGFQADVTAKQAELDKMRADLEESAQAQRGSMAKATLALSLLPLGERQYKIGDFEGAIDAYRRALILDPDSIILQYRLGYVYTQSGKLDEAEKHLTQALKIDKEFAPALACLGYVYRRIGEKMPEGVERKLTLDKASSLLLQALKISPKLIDEDNESWWGSLGGLYRRRGQIDDAIYAYERVAEVTPNSSYAFGNLALLYAQKENVEAMLRMYEKMEPLAWGEVQGAPDNYWGFADLLTARLALGRVEKADEALASVFRTMPMESPYASESLLETLHRLQHALGEEKSAHIQSFIERIQAHITAKNGSTT